MSYDSHVWCWQNHVFYEFQALGVCFLDWARNSGPQGLKISVWGLLGGDLEAFEELMWLGTQNRPWEPLRSIQRAILTLWQGLSASGDVSGPMLRQLKFWCLGSRIWSWDPLKSIHPKILTLWRWLSASGDVSGSISSNFNIFIELWNAGRPELSTWLIVNLTINQVVCICVVNLLYSISLIAYLINCQISKVGN